MRVLKIWVEISIDAFWCVSVLMVYGCMWSVFKNMKESKSIKLQQAVYLNLKTSQTHYVWVLKRYEKEASFFTFTSLCIINYDVRSWPIKNAQNCSKWVLNYEIKRLEKEKLIKNGWSYIIPKYYPLNDWWLFW